MRRTSGARASLAMRGNNFKVKVNTSNSLSRLKRFGRSRRWGCHSGNGAALDGNPVQSAGAAEREATLISK
jgi:hypothetical protein